MTATYDCIATTTLGSAQSSITFSNISGAFTDLVLIAVGGTSGISNTWVKLNSDSGSNYSVTNLVGNGSAASSIRRTNDSLGILLDYFGPQANSIQNYIIHFQNYSNTTTNKTVLVRFNAADAETVATVGLWRSTSAITSIQIYPDTSRNFNTGFTATLYGIKAE